jgi:hypothetical protein
LFCHFVWMLLGHSPPLKSMETHLVCQETIGWRRILHYRWVGIHRPSNW